MARSIQQVRQALKGHVCTWNSCTIKPKDFYVFAQMAPEHEVNSSRKWQIFKYCLNCAKRSGLHTTETETQLQLLTANTNPR